MSIAIHTRSAHIQARSAAATPAVARAQLSRAEQLREAHGLMRHFVLAFVAAGAGLYTAVAAGLTF